MGAKIGGRGRRGLVAAALACAAASGCGGGSDEPAAVPAAGTVSYQGKPVAKGVIHFHPEKGRPASGPIDGGKFSLSTYGDGDGALPGKHKVAVEVTEEVKDKEGDTTAKYLVPQKFANPDTSKITAEVPPGGKTDLVIDVKDAK